MDIPGEPAPSLHPHPSEQVLHSYYEPVRQRASRRYSMPSVSASARSLSRPWGPTTPDAVSTLAFSRSVQEPQTRLTPPLRRTPPGQEHGHPPGSSRRKSKDPRFRCHLKLITTPQQRTPTPSFPGRALSGTSSWSPPDAIKPRLLPDRSPRRSSANAASGWFSARPRRPTLEGQQASISRTAPPMDEVFYTTPPSAFVTHCSVRLVVLVGGCRAAVLCADGAGSVPAGQERL